VTLLELHGVHAYYGRSHVLHDVGLEVGPGEIVALLGRNGSGRTTTLKAIMGLVAAMGDIRLKGRSIAGEPPYGVARAGVAWVPEERRIFPQLTVADNLRLAALGSGRRAPAWDDVYTLFPVLRERREQRAGTLSGGEQQMLAIGRALVARPELILLDEPMEGLAPVVAQDLEAALEAIRDHGIAILLVEQHLRVAVRLASRGYILNDGRVVARGTIAALKADEATMHRYLAV
jgi:branched-chain amino acid transport system ATP-binding protein